MRAFLQKPQLRGIPLTVKVIKTRCEKKEREEQRVSKKNPFSVMFLSFSGYIQGRYNY